MRRIFLPGLVLALLASTGCGFYFADDDCEYGGAYYPGDAMTLRNPYTGWCESFGSWNCDDPCSPCYGAVGAESDAMAMPSWAFCDSYCSSLDEASCMATSGCRAAFVNDCAGADCGVLSESFYACWGTDQTGPIQGGGCEGLDSWECSRHDDCFAVHANTGCAAGYSDEDGAPMECDPLGSFEACRDEPTGCYGNEECPEGSVCNAEELCLPAPDCYGDGESDPGLIDCEAVCYGFCVPGEPPPPPPPPPPPGPAGTCDEALCDSIAPACPADTVPGVADGCYTGYCIPLIECEVLGDAGTCWDEILCYCEAPACPSGTVPGVIDACYSGYCVPESACEEPPVACADISDEDACIDRLDCTPYYEGINCDCDGDACVCEEWVFDSCAASEIDASFYTMGCG